MPCQEATELDRLLVALNCQTQIQAAALLNVRQSSLSDCKRRSGIVSGTLLEKALLLGVRLEWLKHRELPMQKEQPASKKCAMGQYCTEICPVRWKRHSGSSALLPLAAIFAKRASTSKDASQTPVVKKSNGRGNFLGNKVLNDKQRHGMRP